jgi:hypothetical protein
VHKKGIPLCYLMILKPALFSPTQATCAYTEGRIMFTILPIMSAALVAMPNRLSLISTIVQQQVFPLVSANSVTTAHLSLSRRLFSQQAVRLHLKKTAPYPHICKYYHFSLDGAMKYITSCPNEHRIIHFFLKHENSKTNRDAFFYFLPLLLRNV